MCEEGIRDLVMNFHSGMQPEEYDSKCKCFTCNKYGTILCSKICLLVSRSSLWYSEHWNSGVVHEGTPLTLHCNPSNGLQSSIIFWMSCSMEPIAQHKPESQGHKRGLYFSSVMLQGMKTNYRCNAHFHFTHTIRKKNPLILKVLII